MPLGCGEGQATYSFHDRWVCSGSAACDVWANSDAFEQGSFALHLLASDEWRDDITMADARVHNAPCVSYADAEKRGALVCHFLAEYKDTISPYLASRSAAATGQSHVTLASTSLGGTADAVSSLIGPLVRVFAERVAPYFALGAAPPTTLCHVGAGDGSLASQLAARLRLPNVKAVDASATPDGPSALVQPFNGRELPMRTGSCDVTLFAYHLHKASAAHLTPRLLAEARRVTRGYLLLAEDRSGRTVRENERNAALEPHGTFRSENEWTGLLHSAGFDTVASGSMFAQTAPQIYFVAKPRAAEDEAGAVA